LPLQGTAFYNQPSASTGDASTGNAFKKITCYTRWNAFQPQSFYSGSGNGGVVSDVLNRPYAIGYSVLGEAISRSLNIAKMINKAGSVVNADANSGKQTANSLNRAAAYGADCNSHLFLASCHTPPCHVTNFCHPTLPALLLLL
jgi:ABC-type phosphate transport system substrate-binding protein